MQDLSNNKQKLSIYEAMVILGGDGTVLRAISYFNNVPNIYSFNFGTVGYLTTYFKEDFCNLENLIKEEKKIIKRKRLLLGNGKYFLNEAVFTSRTHRLNTFILDIDGLEFTFRGDSLIVATQTGSTGYNHSVGGPILLCDGIVINLVAPNKCNFRPFVVGMNTVIRVRTQSVDSIVIADGVEYDSRDMTVRYNGNEVNFVCRKDFNSKSFFKKMVCNEMEIKF